jgi:hypothetical protein
MKKLIFIITISVVPLIAKSQDYCDFIQNIQNYQDSVKLKHIGDYDVIDSTTFNINTYLSTFDNIEVENGYKIGIYYFDNFLDGKPYLYALKNDQTLKAKNNKTLYTLLNKAETRAKNHITPKDSVKGFLQYLFFAEMGEQFALKWHANYNEKYIICTNEKLEEAVNELKEYNQVETDTGETELPRYIVDLHKLNRFAQIDPNIEIDLTNEYCTITWIENRTHNGCYKCKYKIQRQFPYRIEKISEELLLEITIGFLY